MGELLELGFGELIEAGLRIFEGVTVEKSIVAV
jgi:hypothetical protein